MLRSASSSEPVSKSIPARGSSPHTSPSSADSPSDSTIQSAGAASAETSDSFIEFRDEPQRYSIIRIYTEGVGYDGAIASLDNGTASLKHLWSGHSCIASEL